MSDYKTALMAERLRKVTCIPIALRVLYMYMYMYYGKTLYKHMIISRLISCTVQYLYLIDTYWTHLLSPQDIFLLVIFREL